MLDVICGYLRSSVDKFCLAISSMNILRILGLSLVLCWGCGDSLPIAPVSGTITFEGRPLAGATITTQPIAGDSQNPGPGSFGHTDEQGRFELELVNPARKGAIIGEHRVMITKASGATTNSGPQRSADGDYVYWVDDPRANRQSAGTNWPTRFTNGLLQLTVPSEGTDQANFDLKMKR
jgi:hypothetical protein